MQYFSSEDKNIHKVLSDIADKLEVELNKQIEENPYNFMNYIILMKFNNMAYIYNPNRLNNNIEVYNKAIGLSNTRAQLYTEGGQTYLTIGLYYRNNNEMGKAEVNFNLAIEEFKKAIQLNDQNPEPYRNIVNALASMERYDEAIRYANEAKKIERYGNATWADEMIEKIIE